MPVNALNAALIGAVLENTPKNSTPAATVAEILNIGREAAYRRMRGEVPFTFGEAALVAARLSFSLDRIMGTDDPDCVLFRLDFSDGQTLLEDYPGKVESWIGKMEEIASDEQSEFSLAGSSLPAALYLGYEGLVRFRFFKCFFQIRIRNRMIHCWHPVKIMRHFYVDFFVFCFYFSDHFPVLLLISSRKEVTPCSLRK